MHKPFYASGFLYHLPSQQILLHQDTTVGKTPLVWSFFGGHSKVKEDEKNTFARVIHDLLKVKIDPKQVISVYDYFHTQRNTIHYIVYAEISDAKLFKPLKESSFSWFSQKQIGKLPFLEQTKHDLIVAQRVINLKLRNIEEKLHPTVTQQT